MALKQNQIIFKIKVVLEFVTTHNQINEMKCNEVQTQTSVYSWWNL